VLALHELRQAVGTEKFCEVMDAFGRANAGKKVTAAEFCENVSKATGKDPLRLFEEKQKNLAQIGSLYAIQSFEEERDKTLIVYGTRDEEAGNRSAAEILQNIIRTHWSNETVPVKADREVTDDDLRNRHLLLIGRPDTNRVVERFGDAFPVTFGWRSFTICGDIYAHAGSAVLAATANPLNARYSAVVLAGLTAEATTRTAELIYHKESAGADVMILPNGGKVRALVAPARELVKDLNKKESTGGRNEDCQSQRRHSIRRPRRYGGPGSLGDDVQRRRQRRIHDPPPRLAGWGFRHTQWHRLFPIAVNGDVDILIQLAARLRTVQRVGQHSAGRRKVRVVGLQAMPGNVRP
jgi:hypothetical protein